MINSSASPSCDFRSLTKACAATLHTSTIGNVKIARFERSCYRYIHMPKFRIVWLLRNLSLVGKLGLRDDKNTAFV